MCRPALTVLLQKHCPVAQLAEHLVLVQRVDGSSPSGAAFFSPCVVASFCACRSAALFCQVNARCPPHQLLYSCRGMCLAGFNDRPGYTHLRSTRSLRSQRFAPDPGLREFHSRGPLASPAPYAPNAIGTARVSGYKSLNTYVVQACGSLLNCMHISLNTTKMRGRAIRVQYTVPQALMS